jgi:hypothetical protein
MADLTRASGAVATRRPRSTGAQRHLDHRRFAGLKGLTLVAGDRCDAHLITVAGLKPLPT